MRKFQAPKFLNPKSQNTNTKWFDKPFDRLTVLSRVEGLTTLSQPVESLKVERVEGQITMTELKFHGYYPGVVGKITEIHAVYYNEHWGFDVSFETQVGREFSEFISKFDDDRDGLWVATKNGKFAGAVAIDGQKANTDGARLRWFIVAPEFQNAGVGKELISQAVEFCRKKKYAKVFLWTFEGLDAARRLYERENFRLSETHDVDQWGRHIKEQRFELILQDPADKQC